METIQVVIDSKLLKAADRAARRGNMNRSALMRHALRDYLQRLHLKELEDRDRRGYEALPPNEEDSLVWEKEAQWPDK